MYSILISTYLCGCLVQRCAIDDDDPSLKLNIIEDPKSEFLRIPSSENMQSGNEESGGNKNMTSINAGSTCWGNGKTPVFELRRPLSSKWTTGAGPRIGCVREYPTELQFQALEQVNLSPRVMAGPPSTSCGPIPSPRPSPRIHLSSRVANIGLPSPRLLFPTAN